jgi:hypothetical protein
VTASVPPALTWPGAGRRPRRARRGSRPRRGHGTRVADGEVGMEGGVEGGRNLCFWSPGETES